MHNNFSSYMEDNESSHILTTMGFTALMNALVQSSKISIFKTISFIEAIRFIFYFILNIKSAQRLAVEPPDRLCTTRFSIQHPPNEDTKRLDAWPKARACPRALLAGVGSNRGWAILVHSREKHPSKSMFIRSN
jgi:hypothetical protein